MKRTSIGLLALVALVALGAVAPAMASVDSTTATNVEKEEVNETYTRDELTENGEIYPSMHDSWRPIEERPAAAWVQYYPSGGWVDASENSKGWKYLSPDTTVKRNFVDLTVMDLGDEPVENRSLTVVYWQDRSREVHDEETNTTRTERYAANVSTVSMNLETGETASEIRVPLRAHYDSEWKVTMWLDSSEDSARWTFSHHSLKSAQQSSVSTAGDVAVAIGKTVLIGSILGLVAYGLGRMFSRRALTGPMKGAVWWSLVLGGGQLFLILAAWDSLSNILATTPEVLAVEFALVGLVQGIESRGASECYDAIFLRADVEPVGETARGEPGVEANGLGHRALLLAQDESGSFVVISPGILPWLIRLLGGSEGRQYLDGTDTIKSVFEITRGDADIGFYVSPLSDELVDYRPASVSLSLPSPSIMQVAMGLSGVWFVGLVTHVAGMGWLLGVAVSGLLASPAFIDIRAPNAVIEPAPAHFSDAHANSMVLASHYDAVRTVEDAKTEIAKSEARRTKATEEADEERATTLVEEILGKDDDGRGDIRDIVDTDDELLERLIDGERRESDSEVVMGGD